MEQATDGAARIAHAVRQLPALTSRRHIDLQRVCSSLAGARAAHGPAAELG